MWLQLYLPVHELWIARCEEWMLCPLTRFHELVCTVVVSSSRYIQSTHFFPLTITLLPLTIYNLEYMSLLLTTRIFIISSFSGDVIWIIMLSDIVKLPPIKKCNNVLCFFLYNVLWFSCLYF